MSNPLPNIYEDQTDYVDETDKKPIIIPEYELTEQELQQLNTQLVSCWARAFVEERVP